MINVLNVNKGFPANMKPEDLKPLTVISVFLDGKQQNALVLIVEKVAQSHKGQRYFTGITQDGNCFRSDQLNIIKLVKPNLELT
jgi:hypothetical protein